MMAIRTLQTAQPVPHRWRAVRSPKGPWLDVIPMIKNAREYAPKTHRSYEDEWSYFDRWTLARTGRPATLADLGTGDCINVEAFVAYRRQHAVRASHPGPEHQAAKAAIALRHAATVLAEKGVWHDGSGRSVLASLRIPQSDAERAQLSDDDVAKVLRAVEESPFAERDRT